MKKIIVLILGLIALAFLGYYTINLLNKKGKSDGNLAAFNFEIKDTASIDRIIITESNGMIMELVRNGKSWVDKNGDCVQPLQVENILDACFNIRFKGYVPENAVKNVINRMTTVGIKVQYFQRGEWTKTWYVGGSTPDHYGTYMLVEDDENGKSDLPVICEIQGMKGIIEPRFFADSRRWKCSGIFAYQMEDIQWVNVKFNDHPERSFEVRKVKKDYIVKYAGKYMTSLDTNMVYRYLLNYRRVNFENPNFELSSLQLDSLRHTVPFCELTMKTSSVGKEKLRMWRKKSSGEAEIDDFGDKAAYDINRFWCELPNGEIVKCQYFVFNPLIMGHIYFNPNRYQQQNNR